jgi:hypothetical protein
MLYVAPKYYSLLLDMSVHHLWILSYVTKGTAKVNPSDVFF